MLDMIVLYVLLPAMGALWLITRYLWAQKDAKREKDIDVLFVLHKEDVEKLAQLQLVIAAKHYERSELDERFKQLDSTLREGFKELSTDIREMTQSLNSTYTNHISQHHTKG